SQRSPRPLHDAPPPTRRSSELPAAEGDHPDPENEGNGTGNPRRQRSRLRRDSPALDIAADKPVEDRHIDAGQDQKSELRLEIGIDRKSTRLNSSHDQVSYAVFC